MINIWSELRFIAPEIYLFIGIMLTLLTASFCSSRKHFVSVLLSLVVIACVMIILGFHGYNMFNDEFYTRDLILNGMLVIDKYSVFCRILILFSGFLIITMMTAKSENQHDRIFELPILCSLSLLGSMLMVGCTSLISMYVSMEMMTLPLYILSASKRKDPTSSEAGMKYFILGSLSSGLFLFGASLIYGFTGHLSFEGIYQSIDSTINPALLFGIIFILIAFSFKISAVPFHMWTPDVYQGSPTIITAFFATAPKVAAFAALGRLLFDPFYGAINQWQQVIIFVSAASMIVGSLGAIMQKNFKRLLAYSSIGHMGFALAGYASGVETGIGNSMVYIIIYVTMTISIFTCLLMLKRGGKEVDDIYELNGLSSHHPYLSFAIAVLMFSMAGVPPLAGFFAKFAVLQSLIERDLFITSIIFVVASVISAYYYLNIVKIMYFDKSADALDKYFAPTLVIVAGAGVGFNLLYCFYPAALLHATRTTIELFVRIIT